MRRGSADYKSLYNGGTSVQGAITEVHLYRVQWLVQTLRNIKYIHWPCHGSGGQSPASHRGGPGSIPGQSMWDLWWTKWHWDRFFSMYFGFFLSISFHRCYITRKYGKRLIIFITGLHKKPQGCGATVASAAGPSPKKKNIYIYPLRLTKLHLVVNKYKYCTRNVGTCLVAEVVYFIKSRSPTP
jgi:hypothetical protein